MTEVPRKATTALVGALLAATLFIGYTVSHTAFATHQPADKTTVAASSVDEVGETGTAEPILRDEMKVSSPSDLILQLTAECSILTALQTGERPGSPAENTDSASATGQIRMFVTVDGVVVPVSGMDVNPALPGVQTDDGKVVFCNRTYERKVKDSEDEDGLDTEEDYIRTRAANAFNWFALDTGFNYDSPDNGNNILEIIVWAEYTKAPACTAAESADPIGATCADALVGKRSLIIEPVHAANDENTLPAGESGTTPITTPSPMSSPGGKPGGKP
jgi:hypothetical protein